jgi:hypothetical protein
MQITQKLIRFVAKSRYERAASVRSYIGHWDWRIPHFENDRMTYVIGLFGTGRLYVNMLILKNIGKRAKHFRDTIRLHPGPTSMIYSGHATIKYVSREQALPEVTNRILEGVRSGFADLIFVYRHPLDSLLTNWVWWRSFIRGCRPVVISEAYKNRNDLCADLEQNFSQFETFAEGDPNFFTALAGPRFLSFVEFVEETELFLPSATLSLRLEDFMIDPVAEFSKIAKVVSVDVESTTLHLPPPRTKAFGYSSVKQQVPRFKYFVDGLDEETKRRIEKLGYDFAA